MEQAQSVKAAMNTPSSPLRGEVGAPATGGGDARHIRIKHHARQLRNTMTEAEKTLWYVLRKRELGIKSRRQQPIGNYIVDFVCLDKKIIIDLDGGQHSEKVAYDNKRDAFLTAEGFTVLRFWNHDVFQNMPGVLETITARLAHPHPTSPLKGEES